MATVVEWSGCAGLRKGPVCELGAERTLTLWVRGARQGAGPVEIDGKKTVVAIEREVDGGTRLGVNVPPGSREIQLKDASDHAEWSLTLAEATPHAEIDRLLALGRTGKYAEALAGLEARRAGAPAPERGPNDAAIGRMALALGKVDRAESALRASIAAAEAEGRIADVVKDGAALLWSLAHQQQRYVDARRLLNEMTPFGEQYPEGRIWLAYHAGLLAADTADIRTALESYRAASRSAERLRCANLATNARMEIARLLPRIGRSDEAVALLRTLPIPQNACAHTTQSLNLLWALGEQASNDPRVQHDAELVAAIADVRSTLTACPDPEAHRTAAISAAEYTFRLGEPQGLQREMEAVEALPADRDVLRESRRSDLLGRWYLRRGQPAKARVAFEAQVPAALGVGLLEEAFRGEVGAGRALLALKQRAAAVTRLKRAQHLLTQMLRGVPIAEGRGGFLGGHDDGVRFLVAALVESGAVREALRTARWARSVELAQAARWNRLANLPPDVRRRWDEALERYQRIRNEIEHQAENDWQVPRTALPGLRAARQTRAEEARAALDHAYELLVDGGGDTDRELSTPAAGELYLALFPAPEGWFAFAAGANDVSVRAFRDVAFAAPGDAERVLDAFTPMLAHARRVRLLPYGAADHVSWQAVRWQGRPLIASMEVEYGLDVGTRARPPRAAAESASALLVANPTGDLPATKLEADDVAAALADWRVTRLDEAGATREATLAALPKARLFHYAGHALTAGVGQFSSALLLKDDARVELGDLLAVAAVPEIVVLSACEAAGTTNHAPSLMGLAQAFVAAGASAAVAPTSAIGDSEARAFIAAFYGNLRGTLRGTQPATSPASTSSWGEAARAAFRSAALMSLSDTSSTAKRLQGGTAGQTFRLLVP